MPTWAVSFEDDSEKLAEVSGPTLRRALASLAAANSDFAKGYNSAAMTVEGHRVVAVQTSE